MTTPTTAAELLGTPTLSPRAAAKRRHDRVVAAAGIPGHAAVEIPDSRLRTDIVRPVLSFVVYGQPVTQGSKKIKYIRGKPVPVEASEGLDTWRDSVRVMARQAMREWAASNGCPWTPLNEAVVVRIVLTVPGSDTNLDPTGPPDLDKLERAAGDALAPVPLSPKDAQGYPEAQRTKVRAQMLAERRKASVLHDDSRIVEWLAAKVLPAATNSPLTGRHPAALEVPGAAIQIWTKASLEAAARRPVITLDDGTQAMVLADLRQWARPLDWPTWEDAAAAVWADPASVLASSGPVSLKGRGLDTENVKKVIFWLATSNPATVVPVIVGE